MFKHWFNSNNNDFIRYDVNKSEWILVTRLHDTNSIHPGSFKVSIRNLTSTESNFLIKNYGFLPVKEKNVKNKKRQLYNRSYKKITYPNKKEIRDIIMNDILD